MSSIIRRSQSEFLFSINSPNGTKSSAISMTKGIFSLSRYLMNSKFSTYPRRIKTGRLTSSHFIILRKKKKKIAKIKVAIKYRSNSAAFKMANRLVNISTSK